MLERKRIFITGASKGIGKALALKYANRGEELFLVARNIDELSALVNQINTKGGKAHFAHLDVTNREEYKTVINQTNDLMGGIDLAILNAGVSIHTHFVDYNSDNLRETIETNLFGVAYGLEYIIPLMKSQGNGTIAGVSSIADFRGVPGSSSYSASKSAVSYLLESARPELKPLGIDIVTIRFGFIKTDMTKKNDFYMPLLLTPEYTADKIVSGLDRGKRKIQFPWQMVLLTNIVRLLPYQIYENVISMRIRKK